MDSMLQSLSPQISLFETKPLTELDVKAIQSVIRQHYWHIRQTRPGRFMQACLRKHYRAVEVEKNTLLISGVDRRELLDFLACCRLKCKGKKQPFIPCKYCPYPSFF